MGNKKYTILYIDDLSHLRESYKSAFDESEINMVTFPDAKSGLVEKVSEVKPDLILLDICMPEVNGFEAIQILKGDEKTKNIPVFFFSNIISKDSIKKGIDLGADDYIIKTNCPPEEAVRVCLEYLKDSQNYKHWYKKNI